MFAFESNRLKIIFDLSLDWCEHFWPIAIIVIVYKNLSSLINFY